MSEIHSFNVQAIRFENKTEEAEAYELYDNLTSSDDDIVSQQEFLSFIDEDGDGVISADEWHDFLKQADLDRDKAISENEFNLYRDKAL